MSKPKLGISIGHYVGTANGVASMSEFDFNSAVGKYAKELAELNGFQTVLPQTIDGKKSIKLQDRTDLFIKEKVDLAFDIHADANASSNVRGHWVFYWHNDEESKKLAEIWDKHKSELSPIPRRGLVASRPGTWTNFHMTRTPSTNSTYNFPAILMEHGFMTSPEDLKHLKDDNFRKLCAKVLVKSACEYMGMQFVDFKEEKEDDKVDVLNRVQTGAFKNRDNADRLEARLKADGYPTYMVVADGLFKVQVGAFAKRSNAINLEKELKSKGYDTYITTKSGTPAKPSEKPPMAELKVGSKVKVKQGAKDWNGTQLASSVYRNTYDVIEISGNRVVFGIGSAVTAAIHKSNLILQ